MRLLPRQRKHASDVLLPQRAQIAAVEQDASFLRVEEPQQEVRDGRLPDAARADEGDPRTGLEPEVEASSAGEPARIARADALERHGDGHHGRRRRTVGVANGRLACR